MSIRNGSVLRKQQGISLPELVVFIVIVGIALVSVVTALNFNTQHSADPLMEKQAWAIAEALLDEVEGMPFNNCLALQQLDVATGTCVAVASKSRGSMTVPFDNVLDYNDFALSSGDPNIGSSAYVTAPPGYLASVSVQPAGAFGLTVSPTKIVLITVTVTYSGGSVMLEGYRAKF